MKFLLRIRERICEIRRLGAGRRAEHADDPGKPGAPGINGGPTDRDILVAIRELNLLSLTIGRLCETWPPGGDAKSARERIYHIKRLLSGKGGAEAP